MSKNFTSLLLFMQSLPREMQYLPAGIPFEIKIGMILATSMALVLTSYIRRRSYLEANITALEKKFDEMEQRMEERMEESLKRLMEMESKILVVEQCVEFMFTNTSLVQKALYKKLVLEEKYQRGSKEPYLVKNRQQAFQDYSVAKMAVASRFNEV